MTPDNPEVTMVERLAQKFMGAHWSWDGNKPSNFMVTHEDNAMALARIAIVFCTTELTAALSEGVKGGGE